MNKMEFTNIQLKIKSTILVDVNSKLRHLSTSKFKTKKAKVNINEYKKILINMLTKKPILSFFPKIKAPIHINADMIFREFNNTLINPLISSFSVFG